MPTIGFNSAAYSVMEGDTATVCAAVLCGRLLQDETVMLSTKNDTAIGYCMKLSHAI